MRSLSIHMSRTQKEAYAVFCRKQRLEQAPTARYLVQGFLNGDRTVSKDDDTSEMKDEQFSMYMPEEMKKQLNAKAKKAGITASHVVRILTDQVVATNEQISAPEATPRQPKRLLPPVPREMRRGQPIRMASLAQRDLVGRRVS